LSTRFTNNTLDGVNLFYQPLIPDGVLSLDATESKHATRVLRKKAGDPIQITDGKGKFYRARLTRADTLKSLFSIEETITEPIKTFSVHVAIAPTKNIDRLEWFVEKTVEVGIDEITLITCKHSERSHPKLERLEKIAISAMKQSLKATLPRISGPVSFSEMINTSHHTQRFIAHVDLENDVHLKHAAIPGSQYIILIGPEGDFSGNEIELAMNQGFRKVSLGTSRLRTETAGLAACHILNLVNTP
jgi:16S rRNA (uracil1498-N3)-methyltransferase